MKTIRRIPYSILMIALAVSAFAQKAKLGENAALRYWAAFAQMQDSAITAQQAKELNTILEGTAPYDDSKYRDLVERNRPALVTMALGTSLPDCDWGIDYMRGDDEPVDYVRKALALGRLNVLYAFHLQIAGDKDGSVRALTTGLRFSQDVANGGTLFATVVAKDLLVSHLRAIVFTAHAAGLSAAQRSQLQKAVARLGPSGLVWEAAMTREMQALNRPDWQVSVPLGRVTQAYVAALNDSSNLPKLEQIMATVPLPLRDVIPNPSRVLEEKQDLTDKLSQTRSMLQ